MKSQKGLNEKSKGNEDCQVIFETEIAFQWKIITEKKKRMKKKQCVNNRK